MPLRKNSIAPLAQWIEHVGEPIEGRGSEPHGFPDEHRELRPLGGEREHPVDHSLGALPVHLGALEGRGELDAEPLTRGLQARLEHGERL
jgi:hypothetical protein